MHVGCVCCRAIIVIILPLLFSLDNEMLQNYLACILQVQHLTEFIEFKNHKLIARGMNSFNSQSWVKYMKMLLRALLIHVFC